MNSRTAQGEAPHPDEVAGELPVDAGHVVDPAEMIANSQAAANFMKALAHENRLMILCHLTTGEKSVTELENLLSSRQAAVSQQLARLRLEGLVSHRRDGKTIYYSIRDPKARQMIDLVFELFCAPRDGS